MRMFSRMGISGGNGARIGAEKSAPEGELINPIIVREKTGSRALEMTGTGARLTRFFNIVGLDDTVEAATYGPPVGDTMPGGLVATRRITEVDTDQKRGQPILTLTVEYNRERGEGVSFQNRDDFRLSGESVNIKQVRKDDDAKHFTSSGLVTSGGATEDGRMIGYNKNTLEAEGVSVLDPILNYSALRHLDTLSTAQLRTITQLQGRVNKGSFFGFSPGEVLFLGASIRDLRNQGVWAVQYEFQIRFNRTLKITLSGDDGVDGDATVPKEGWEFLTFNLADKGDKAAPQYAHVWAVYEKANIGGLPELGRTTPWANRSTFPPILSST